MANKQINELTEITSVEETDLLVVYDIDEAGTEKTKKILKSNFLAYEEGTWTPEIADALVGGNTGTSDTAAGRYTKIGNKVTVTVTFLNINTAEMTGGNTFYIRNLPFTPNFTGSSYCVSSVYLDQVSWTGDYAVAYNVNAEAIHLRGITKGGAVSAVIVSQLTSGTADIIFTMTYFTS